MNHFNKKRKLRICFFSFYGYSLFNRKKEVPFGGSEVQLYLISRELSKLSNYEVTVIIGDKNLKRRIEIANNLKLHVVLPLEKKILNYFKGLVNLISSLLIINPDVIIQRSIGIPTLILSFYCKFTGKKFVYSIASEKDVVKTVKKGIIGRLFRFALNFVDFFIAQNADQVKKIRTLKGNRINRLKVIKNAFLIEDVNINEKKNILWVGRAIKEKQPEVFINLAKKFPEEDFVMICLKNKYNLSLLNYWREIFQKARLLKNMKFYEFIPFNKIDNFFKEAKIFVNTSIREGFPNAFIQALKNKTPIVSLSVNPDGFISKYKCGFYCNNNQLKMEENILKLLKSDTIFEEYSKNAYDYVKKNHDIKENMKLWDETIKELIEDS